MTLLEVKDWLSVISVGGLVVTGVALNWLRGQFATKGDLAEAKAEHLKACLKTELIEDRLAKVEGELNHLPDQSSIHRMELALSGMRGDLNVMAERMTSVASTGQRLQEFLVDQAGKRS